MDSSLVQKAEQIAYRFFTKFALVVDNARIADERREINKTDKWFNLETPDIEEYKRPLRIFQNVLSFTTTPRLELQLVLVVPELGRDQVLVHTPRNSSRIQVEPAPSYILLESWLCCFLPHSSSGSSASSSSGVAVGGASDSNDITLPTVYKHSISIFRSLYTLLRLLPAWKLCKRLQRRLQSNLSIDLRLITPDNATDANVTTLGFDTPLSSTHGPCASSEQTIPAISHPFGSFSVSVRYLTEPYFNIDTRESLLSSHLLSQAWDGANAFTPTIASARSRERESLSGVASGMGSLPARMSMPRSPPRQIAGANTGGGIGAFTGPSNIGAGGSTSGRDASLADRFVLPLGNASRTSLSSNPNTSPLARMTPLPGTSTAALPLPTPGQRPSPRTSGEVIVGSAGSAGSSTRLSAEGHRAGAVDLSTVSIPGTRTRKESLGRGMSTDVPPSATSVAFPQRRPSLNAIHPFKSGTLVPTGTGAGSPHSPASSLRHGAGSPLPTIPARVPAKYDTRTLSAGGTTQPFPISTTGVGHGMMRSPSSPVAPFRPSPPFASSGPSSLDREKRNSTPAGPIGAFPSSGESEQSSTTGAPRRKRYSSSFGHRYAAVAGAATATVTGAGEGESGNGEKKEDVGERKETGREATTSTAPYLDDDDLSAFVNDIDSRVPLSVATGAPGAPRLHGLGFGASAMGRAMSEKGSGTDVSIYGAQPVSVRPGGLTSPRSPPRFSAETRRVLNAPEIRERTMSEGRQMTRHGETEDERGKTLEERLRRLNEDFKKSLENLEGRGTGADKGKRKEREKSVEGLGLDAPTSSNGERRIDSPTSPTFLNVQRPTLSGAGVSGHARSSSLSDRPQVRGRMTVLGPLPRYRQYTSDAVPTLASNTGLVPRPLSPRRVLSSNVYAELSERGREYGSGIEPHRQHRHLTQQQSQSPARSGVSDPASLSPSVSGPNSNANSAYVSGSGGLGLGLTPSNGTRARTASRLSSESGGASGGRSGGSSELVGGRMELGP